MILRSLEVRNLRCFRNPIRVGPFGDRVNIIHGPNEVGKSTLMEAAALAVFDRHSTAGAEIESLQPWGTNLSPEIVLEFESDGIPYRLEKAFLAERRSRLHQQLSGTYEPICEGDEADAKVRAVLLAEGSRRGRASPDQWGTARLLWSLQRPGGGHDRAVPRVTEAVADRLRRALGGIEISSHTAELLTRIEERCATFFTRQRGDYRTDSPIAQLRAALAAKQADRERAQEGLREVRGWAERLLALRSELGRLALERKDIEAAIRKHRKAAQALITTKEQLKRAEMQQDAAIKERDAAARTLRVYQEYYGIYQRKRLEWRQLSGKCKTKEDEIAVLDSRLRELRSELQELEKQQDALRRRLERARQTDDALALHEQISRLREQVKEVKSLGRELGAAEAELRATRVPTQGDIQRAGKLERRCIELDGQIEARGLRVTVHADADQRVDFTASGRTHRKQLSVGEEAHFTSATAARLSFPGLAHVDVESGATELSELQEQRREAKTQLETLLGEFGVRSAADLAARAQWAKARRDSVRDIESRIRQGARPFASPEELEQELAKATARLKTTLQRLGVASPRKLISRQREDSKALASEIDGVDKDIRACRRRTEEARQALENARLAREELRRERELCATQRDAARQRADELLGDAKDEAGLKRALRDAKQRVAAASKKTECLRKQLPPPEADPEQLRETAERSLEDVERRERLVGNQIAVLEDKLHAAETQGRYQALSELEEEIAALGRRLQREVQRAIGIRLLQQVLLARRQEVGSGALAGLEEQVSRVLSAVTREHERQVRIAPDFAVTGVRPGATEDQVRAVDALSAGTQEQLWLVVRIALGETYAHEYGRQVMVLDDVLVYTDPDRHDRMLEVLQQAADRLQVFILTSRPALYRGITDACYQFDIEALRT